jgi:hypothetical protein
MNEVFVITNKNEELGRERIDVVLYSSFGK